MASTEKVSLSFEAGSLLLARRAAELEGMSLSAYISRLVKQYAWASQRPRLNADEQACLDERLAEVDEQEIDLWRGGGERRAAG